MWQVFEYGIGGGVKEVRQGGDNRCGKNFFFFHRKRIKIKKKPIDTGVVMSIVVPLKERERCCIDIFGKPIFL
ncbi:hypothetical protein ACFSQ7_33950 [Paenibacillus rhizoplanae]